MQYLMDTVAVIRHFTGKGKIGNSASSILNSIETSDDFLIISVISLMEIMYLAEKNRIKLSLKETLDTIDASSKYTIVNLNPDILKVAESLYFNELHDRLILATAKWLDIPLISSDSKFKNIFDIKMIWD